MIAPLVITTPTGKIGSKLVPLLLEAGQAVRVVARHPDKLDPAWASRVEVIHGSSDDVEVLRRALEDALALFWCIPPTDDDPMPVYTRFTQALLGALVGSSVGHVVSVSSGGKGLAVNAGPISALHAMEDLLSAGEVSIRHLRCGNFMENFLYQAAPMKYQGTIFYPMRGDVPMPHVCSQDIAARAFQLLSDLSWSDQQGVGVHGPEDLSLEQAAGVLGLTLEKEIRFQALPAAVFKAAQLERGAAETDVQSLIEMCQAAEAGIYAAEPRTPQTTTPTSLLEWARRELRPVVDAV